MTDSEIPKGPGREQAYKRRIFFKLEDESPQSFCSAERRESSLALHFSDDSSQPGHSGHSHRNPQDGVRLRHLAVPRLKASPVSAVISILTSSRRQPGRGRRWRSFQCPGGALVAGERGRRTFCTSPRELESASWPRRDVSQHNSQRPTSKC